MVSLPHPVCVAPLCPPSPPCPSRGFSPEPPLLPQPAQHPGAGTAWHSPNPPAQRPAACSRAPSLCLLLPPQLLNCIMDMVEKTRRSLTVLRRCQEADREELNHWIRRYSDAEDMKKGSPPSARPHNSSSSAAEAPQLGTDPRGRGLRAGLLLSPLPGVWRCRRGRSEGTASPKGVPSLLCRRSPGLCAAAALRVHARGDLEEGW